MIWGLWFQKKKSLIQLFTKKLDVVTLSGLISPSLKEMEKVLTLFNENNLNIPVLIAGAAASKLHTAIKLEPVYKGRTLYVSDALDTLPVISALCSDKKDNFLKEKTEALYYLKEIYNNNKKSEINNISLKNKTVYSAIKLF